MTFVPLHVQVAERADTDRLLAKLKTIHCLNELTAFAAGDYREAQISEEVRNAIARRKIQLQKGALK